MKNNQVQFLTVIFPEKPNPVAMRTMRDDPAKIFDGEPYCNSAAGIWMADISQTPKSHSRQDVVGLLQKCGYYYFEDKGSVIYAYYAW